MGKWILILLACAIGLAILGFLIEAARFLIGLALLVLVAAFLVRFVFKGGARQNS